MVKAKKKDNFLGNNKESKEVQELLKQYEHLDQVDGFVGSQFITPKGGTLTVVGWDGVARSGSNKKFTCHCSLCSESDPELFPSNIAWFKSSKNHLLLGRQCCGCGSKYKYKDFQEYILDVRSAEDVGYIFKEYTGSGSHSHKRFVVECPVCSKDKELWPYGSIKTCRSNIKNGVRSCGCGNSVKWSESQYKVRINRVCAANGYVYLGWVGGYNKQQTKVGVYNPATNNRWYQYSIKDILSGLGLDPALNVKRRSESQTLPDEKHIKDFMTSGKFLQGTEFWRSDFKNNWDYTCPECSNDEYVEAGLCSGVFSGSTSGLKSGVRSCRCAPNYRWTKDQTEFTIKNLCADEGFLYIGIEDYSMKRNSVFKWVCNNGHLNNSIISNFINIGCRCKECAVGFNGYYPDRKDELDWLYVIRLTYSDGSSHLKCGRSFRYEKRFKELSIASQAVDLEKLHLYSGSHQQVYGAEQEIKKLLYKEGYNYFDIGNNLWDGSTECYTDNKETMNLLLGIVKDSLLFTDHL